MSMEETSVRHVINWLILLVIYISPEFMFSQNNPPVFTWKDSTITLNANQLYWRLSDVRNIMSELRNENEPCYSGIGLFKFIVKQDGTIEITSFTGRLPSKLVEKVKQNIESTSQLWLPEIRNGIVVNSYPFTYLVSYDLNMGGCDSNKFMPNYLPEEVEIALELSKIFQMYEKKDSFLVTEKGYFLPVHNISSIK